MKKYLSEVINNNEKGLYICRLPTGYGKSYAVEEVIREMLDNTSDTRKIIYLTSLKKNLPNSFVDSDDVLILRSNLDQITKILTNLDIPENFQTEAYHKTRRLAEKLNDLKKKNKTDNEYIKSIEKELSDSEKSFRRELQKHLKRTFRKRDMRLNAIRTQSRYHWIGELYPAVYTDNKRVLIMTVKKFLSKNSVIVDRSYDFITAEFMEDAVIFIDEFDATKAVITDHLIERALSVSNDYLNLFKAILNGLELDNISTNLRNALSSTGQLFDKINVLIENGDELIREFQLDHSYKMRDESVDRHQNFLFNDGNFHTIFERGKNYIRSCFDENSNSVLITTETKEDYIANKSENDIVIFSMLRNVRSFLSRFRFLIYEWAESYRKMINAHRSEEYDELSIENAVSTILNEIGLAKTQQELLLNECCPISSFRRTLLPERSYYSDGFEIFEFEDSDEHNESTEINYIKVYDTPEKIVRYISERSTVFAISATADMPTVFGNYDLSYFRETLGTLYHEQNNELSKRSENEIRNNHTAYENGSITIHTETLNTSFTGEIIELCKSFMSSDNAKLAAHMISNMTDKKYAAGRYCSILRVMHSFFEHKNIHALLCLQNALPSDEPEMNEELLRNLFKLSASDLNENLDGNALFILRTTNFDKDKETVLGALSNGDRRLVISSYSTIGAGQNLQYEVNDKNGFIELCPCKNIADKRHFSADFDALYLGSITNLTVNTYSDGSISKEELMKMLFQIESLYYNGELNYDNTDRMIKLAFNSFSNNNDNNPNLLYKTESMRNYVTLLTIQAIGRMCRTFLKRPDIYLYADDTLLTKLNTSLLQKYSPSPEMAAIVNECNKLSKKYSAVEDRKLNIAERVSTCGMRTIRQMLSKNWTQESMALWVALRETVLRHPTADKGLTEHDEIIRRLYIASGESINRYIYSQYSDFNNVVIDFEGDIVEFKNSDRAKIMGEGKERVVMTMSEEDSGLTFLMKYAPLREYFIESGYAVCFEKNPFIMSPVLYHNIYKGVLGETAGRFILKNERGIELIDITDPQKFEFFDYMLAPDVYVDFKNWKYTYVQDKEKTRAEILAKLDAIGGKRVYVINMTDTHNCRPNISLNGRIIEIPSLVDESGNIKHKMLDMIKEEK